MTQLSDCHAQLLLAQRERDRALAECFKLRDKLMECAKECSECGGTGLHTVSFPETAGAQLQECPECADIRSLLE